MTASLRQTPLHDWHVARGGRMVDFAGWSMPVQYGSIVEEHNTVRNKAGLFDVSHMGRLRVEGPGALAYLDSLVTRKVAGMGPGKIRYGLVCNEAGGILDDILVYHLQQHGGGLYALVVVNASNRDKIVSHFQAHLPASGDVTLDDRTLETAMIAVQGPKALAVVEPLVGVDVGGLSYYTGTETTICGKPGIVSRTGYTGEDGCEVILPAEAAKDFCDKCLEHGVSVGAAPAGLGARDTLRLEAAMPLYGHELSESLDPLQAGLDFAVTLEGREFLGRQAILNRRADKERPVRVGLELAGRRAAREHYAVYSGDKRVGEVTSGAFAPTVQKAIAMAYVEPQLAAVGTELAVDIRGTMETARVVSLPFYKRPKTS
ncbi:glycine cleavage system T protein [Pirellula staleyi DSM 6068]|uniref:Aminomethyltransferase n=1 Tax=Pirellula staleyi (strain ATCC 27377 / DSM 6068 / ICPB 4128) TaxID=530564 RepID=D2R7Y4_PIRSD|nr:glycine cleavage system aminomethyltransferase GcvT [Pirellula staleyi]ADB19315.1 glycine cleavage system T protein [Pirellula staleyi DSM 6068]